MMACSSTKMSWLLLLMIVGASSGFIMGYEFGIIGGVTLMPEFLNHLFPKGTSEVTHYHDKVAFYVSHIYYISFFPIVCIFPFVFTNGKSSKRLPSRICIMLGGIFFLAGAVVSAAAINDLMISVGRLLLGFGLGFIQQVPIYISETAHHNYRGALNIGFHMMITVGICVAHLVNYATNDIKGWWSWRVSFGVAAVPAVIILIGSFLLPDTPGSIIEQGDYDRARCTLQHIHGTTNVDKEFNSVWDANEASKTAIENWRTKSVRKHTPYYVMAIAIPIFQQLAGINAMVFYAPLLFKAIGFGSNACLRFALVIGGVNVAATFLAIVLANRLRRRSLLIAGGLQIFVCQIILGTLGVFAGTAHAEYANLIIVAFICLCVSGFAWSWGPLGWSLPNEIFPVEIRSIGEGISLTANSLSSFIVTQFFISMLDHYKYSIFYISAFFALTMTLFAIYLMPETNGTPIEEMSDVWSQHWFWSEYLKLKRPEC